MAISHFISEEAKLTKLAGHSTAATTDVTSSALDMEGFDGVLFFTSYGTAAADNLFHVEQSSDDGSSDAYTDVAGSEMNLAGASDEDQVLDIINPEERYLKVIAERGTSSTLESIWALQYRADSLVAMSSVTGTQIVQRLVAPVAGTK